MNEEVINDLYNNAVSKGYKKSREEFISLLQSNDAVMNDMYTYVQSKGYKKGVNDFKDLIGATIEEPVDVEPKKKEDTTGLPSGVGSSASSKLADDLRALGIKVEQDESILTKKPREAKIGESKMLAASESTRVPNLRIPQKEQQADELDKKLEQIKKDRLAALSTPSNEEDYFQGTFGDMLRAFDSVSPIGIGDFADDMARAVASGYRSGDVAQAAGKLILSGTTPSMEEIQNLIDKQEKLQQIGSSKEFQDYQKIYEKEGKGVWGFISGISQNPSILPEVMASSMTSIATNTDAVIAALGAIGTGAAIGAATTGTAGATIGSVVPVAGTAAGGVVGGGTGAISGAISSLPYAFGLASTIVETGSTFAQLLQEELGTDESGNPIKLTKENVKSILEDPEKYNDIRNKAITRGIAIGVIDTFTGKLSSGVGAKILKQSAAKSATGAATKQAVVGATAAGTGIESAGGSFGEAVASALIGQELDTGNILLEGIAEMPGGLRSTLTSMLRKPTYKVGKENVSAQEIDNLIETMTPEQLVASKIVIDNDFEGRKERMQDKIISGSIAREIKEAQPDLNEPTVNAIVDLQKELNKLEGNKTQVAKDKAAQIRADIKNLQENPLPDTPAQEAPVANKQQISELTDKISRIENALSLPDITSETEFLMFDKSYTKPELENELETLKQELNAVQKQAAGQVPVQPEARVGQEVAQGEPQAEPQVVTQEGQEEVVPTEEELDLETKLAEDLDVIKSETKPRLRVEGIEIPAEEDIDVETIETNLDRLPAYEVNFTTPTFSQDIQVNPIEESKSQVKEGTAETKPIESFEGVPMVVGMSDILAAGKVTDSMGNPMDVEGGLLYNVLGKNKNAAWAGVTQKGAQTQYNEALQLYKNNKNLFEKLWAEGKLPNGHVPMAIMKMADTAVNSNEAVYRYLNPLVKSQPEANQKAALDALKGDIEVKKKVKQKAIVKSANKLGEFISKNNISSLGQLLDTIIVDANNRAKGDTKNTLSLTERSLLFDLMISPQGIKEASKNTVNALFGSKKDPRAKAFLADTIYNDIAEPSMMKTPKGNIVAVVGIDVLNGGVIPVEHGNYGFGPKGQMIALISNPKHGLDVFPEWKAKAARVFKKSKGGAIPSEQKIADEVGGAFYIDKAFRGAKVSMEPSDIELLSAKLRFAFPDVTISNSKEEFDRVLQEEGVRTKESGGKVILGMTKDGKVYLNPESDSLATPIHEFGHIWIDFLRSKASGKKGDALLSKGLSLVEGTKALQQAIAKYGDNALAREEALVELMATKGETIINKSKQKEFKNWLNALFKYIKEFFITSEQLFKGTDFEQKLKAMSLDDFINIGLADLLKGKEVSSKFKAKEAGKGAAELRFRVGDNVQSFINKARAQGYSETAIKNVLTRSGVDPDTIDAALAKAEPAAKKVEVTEEFAPGYGRVLNEIFGKDGIVDKSRRRGRSEEDTLKNAIDYLQQDTKVYENATDVQREAMFRDVSKRFKKREKSAPSAKRILGQKKDVVTITVDLAKERDRIIKEQIKQAKEVTGDLNAKRRMIADAINKMATDGKITTKKAEAIIKRASRLNVDSEVSVNKFIDYVSKVFADAEYTSKLSTGNSLRNKIKNISKNKDKAANLRDLGVKFSEIDPSMVEDIDQYNEVATKIFESINGSTLKGGVKFADIVRISDVSDYINKTIEKQRKEILKGKIDEMSELLGIEITEEEYFKIIESINNNEPLPKKYKDGAIRKAIDRAFNVYSAIIDDIFKTGKDPVTGEEVSISDKKKKVVKDFMSMDLNLLSDKEALAAIDSLMNFLQNGSTAKMSAIYNRNLGEKNAIKLDKKGFKSFKLKKYFSPGLAKVLVEQFTQLDLVIERMFKGFTKAGDFMFEAGISALKKGKSLAQSLNNKIVDNYFNTFYKSKPNGQAFNTIFNTVERGMTAYMMRTMPGTEAEINAEFKKKKSLIEQSIANLNKGNDKKKELASVYTEVYDKLVKGSENYDDVVSKADPKNVEAVRFWQNEWANKYEDLSDLSESIYNKTLGRDLNYTPVRVSNTGDGPSIDENSDEMNRYAMSFHINNQTTYQRETGVLMTPTLDDKLSKETFIDLSFDKNNANSMYDALIDLNTADAVRQIAGFFNSDSFENIIQNADDRGILKGRVNLFIRNIRNKTPYDNDQMAKAMRTGLQNLAALGAGRALAGPTQALKQTLPVIMNTISNAGRIDLTVGFNKDKNDFINNSGYAIANRSAASINQIESINKLADKAAKSLPSKIIDPLLQLNELQLKLFLQKPDSYVARASWMSYYEKSLRQQGIDTKSIDYATHQINDKAADYAQRMVDRQQNLSDMDLAGKFVGSKFWLAQFVNKTVMPFSSFRINQSARLGSDWAVLTSKVSTTEDRVVAARSLGGFFSEMVTFRAMSATIAVVLASVASLISGREDEEEDREKLFDMIIKNATTSSIIDIVSFLPYMDDLFQAGIATSLDVVQDMLEVEDADKFPFYDPKDKSWVEGLGMLGITGERTRDLINLIDIAYTRDYKDDFGRTKYITEEDADILKNFVLLNILSSVGLASPEIKTMTRRTLANVKRRSSTNESGIKREKGSGTRSSGSGAPKTINKTDMKKYFPDMYNELYGPGSPTYEVEQEVKAFEKEQRKMEEQIKKEIYGGS